MCGDPAKTILQHIDADLRAHSERVQPLGPDLLERAKRLVEGVDTTESHREREKTSSRRVD